MGCGTVWSDGDSRDATAIEPVTGTYSNVTIITILSLYDRLVYYISGCKKKLGVDRIQNSNKISEKWEGVVVVVSKRG